MNCASVPSMTEYQNGYLKAVTELKDHMEGKYTRMLEEYAKGNYSEKSEAADNHFRGCLQTVLSFRGLLKLLVLDLETEFEAEEETTDNN